MKRRQLLHQTALTLGTLASPRFLSAEAAPLAVFTPKQTDELLVNPCMGYETYFCFNNDQFVAIDKSKRPTKEHGPYKYPPSSVAMFRFYWADLEPEEGKYNFDLIDEHLAKARANGQQLGTRFTAFHTHTCPQWYQKKAQNSYTIVSRRSEKDLRRFSPNYQDADFLKRQEDLAIAFAERYNGHADLAYVDIGHIGSAGEWHNGNSVIIENGVDTGRTVPLCKPAQYQHLIDLYIKHWDKTLLHINEQSHEIGALEYALKRGVGWRYDGWGFVGVTAEFPKVLESIGGTHAWKKAPVRYECCEPGKWMAMPLDLFRQQHEFALSLHMSGGHGKMLQLSDEKWEVVRDFVKRCGYRFVCQKAELRRTATGTMLRVEMENKGVAPVYRDYILAVRTTAGDQQRITPSTAKVRDWLPGKHVAEIALDLPAGKNHLALALLDSRTQTPAIQFANEGRSDDRWHTLGECEI